MLVFVEYLHLSDLSEFTELLTSLKCLKVIENIILSESKSSAFKKNTCKENKDALSQFKTNASHKHHFKKITNSYINLIRSKRGIKYIFLHNFYNQELLQHV